jgi:hypothetical protein
MTKSDLLKRWCMYKCNEPSERTKPKNGANTRALFGHGRPLPLTRTKPKQTEANRTKIKYRKPTATIAPVLCPSVPFRGDINRQWEPDVPSDADVRRDADVRLRLHQIAVVCTGLHQTKKNSDPCPSASIRGKASERTGIPLRPGCD